MKSASLTVATLAVLGCSVTNQSKDQAPPPVNATVKKELKTKVFLTLPDRSYIEDEGDDAFDNINSYYYRAWTIAGSCNEMSAIEKSSEYEDDRRLSFNLNRACDHNITLSLGYHKDIQKLTLAENDMIPTAYYTSTISIKKRDLEEKDQLEAEFDLWLSQEGEKAGFSTQAVNRDGIVRNAKRKDNPNSEEEESKETDDDPESEKIELVTYNSEIKEMLDDNCISCHIAGGSRSNSDLSSYDSLQPFLNAIVNRISNGTMPLSGPLDDEDIKLIEAWKEGDFKE